MPWPASSSPPVAVAYPLRQVEGQARPADWPEAFRKPLDARTPSRPGARRAGWAACDVKQRRAPVARGAPPVWLRKRRRLPQQREDRLGVLVGLGEDRRAG